MFSKVLIVLRAIARALRVKYSAVMRESWPGGVAALAVLRLPRKKNPARGKDRGREEREGEEARARVQLVPRGVTCRARGEREKRPRAREEKKHTLSLPYPPPPSPPLLHILLSHLL
eukprot:scaffold123426_cov31-Tisochrysis_lutea.AAC.8